MAKTKKKRKNFIPAAIFGLCVGALTILASVVFIMNMDAGEGRPTEVEMTTYGVDVARYQGTIDWAQMARSNVDFAMVRLGYRTMVEGEITEDSNARYNLQQASENGIKLGAYFFSTAITPEEAQEEARWVAEMLQHYPITYPVAYNCENFKDPQNRHSGLSVTERTDIALAFLKEIEKQGYEAMFYASKNEMEGDILWEVSRIEGKYKIWVAQYPETPYPETSESDYSGVHHMWQYTKEGQAEGVDGPVDLDIAYFGYTGTAKPKVEEEVEEAAPDVEAMMTFVEVSEEVTAKEETNLRDIPSQDETATVLDTLYNGEIALRTGISDSGWSRLEYEGRVYYAVSSYLTTELTPPEPTEDPSINTVFQPVDDYITAKERVNLRNIPSAKDPRSEVVAELKKGEVIHRTGVNKDVGWSRVVYNGQILYCVTQYTKVVEQD